MGRLEFCADENVPSAYVTAIESNGFVIADAARERGEETVDETLLEWAAENGRVLVTNDRDFVDLHGSKEHAGLIVYTDHALSPGEFAQAIRRIDRRFTHESIRNVLLWLNDWN